MQWNWGDVTPVAGMSGTGDWSRNLKALIKKDISYLTSFSCNSKTQQSLTEAEKSNIRTKAILEDATSLTKLTEKFNIIVTDPPYSIDVPYGELSTSCQNKRVIK